MWNTIKKIFNKNKPEAPKNPSSNKEELLNKVISIFENEPYCLGGFWNWAGSTLDLVFPEIAIYNSSVKKWIGSGLVVQVFDKEDKTIEDLVSTCYKNQVYLVALRSDISFTKEELFSKIESLFGKDFHLPRTPLE